MENSTLSYEFLKKLYKYGCSNPIYPNLEEVRTALEIMEHNNHDKAVFGYRKMFLYSYTDNSNDE